MVLVVAVVTIIFVVVIILGIINAFVAHDVLSALASLEFCICHINGFWLLTRLRRVVILIGILLLVLLGLAVFLLPDIGIVVDWVLDHYFVIMPTSGGLHYCQGSCCKHKIFLVNHFQR